MSEVIDGEAIEVGHDLVPVQHGTGIQVAPEVTAKDLVARLGVIREAMRTAMERDIDYGVIPGTAKPTLLKPGSEKLGVLFQLDLQLENEKLFDGDHLTVMSKAIVYYAPTGTRLGMGEGMCSTKESKYAWRNESRKCPACGKEAIIKGKAEYGGGWLCFKKKDGCGAKYQDGDPEIEKQNVGKIPNPDLPDLWNTCLKIAEKRARIDAVLAVTGASALFTQDMESDESAESEPTKSTKSTTEAEVRSDGKLPAKGAKSWSEWTKRMTDMEVPRPTEWLKAAAEASGLTEKKWGGPLAQKANTVLMWFADNEAQSSLGFYSIPEVQRGWAAGFDGTILDDPPITESDTTS